MTKNCERAIIILFKKTDGIITKLKQANDWVETIRVVAQPKHQKYIDKFRTQKLKYKIK